MQTCVLIPMSLILSLPSICVVGQWRKTELPDSYCYFLNYYVIYGNLLAKFIVYVENINTKATHYISLVAILNSRLRAMHTYMNLNKHRDVYTLFEL